MIRLGIIGCGGRVSSLINDVFRKIDPSVKVSAIIDPDVKGVMERLSTTEQKDVKIYDSVEAMLRQSQLDGILIGTRCDLHAKYAIEVSNYDLPLFLEKPVATNFEDAVALENAFCSSRCQVVVSFPLRFSPICTYTKKMLLNGAIGELQHITALNYVPYGTTYFENFYRDFSITQGLFVQKATHDFDYLAFLANSPIKRIAAIANFGRVFGGNRLEGLRCSQCNDAKSCLESPYNRTVNNSSDNKDDHLCLFSKDCGLKQTGMNEDCSSALYEFANGTHGIYTQVFFSRKAAKKRGAILSGYMGTISFDWYKNEIDYVAHHEPVMNKIQLNDSLSHFGGDWELCKNFLDVVTGKEKSRATIISGLQSIYTCLAAKEACQRNEFVNVRQVGF